MADVHLVYGESKCLDCAVRELIYPEKHMHPYWNHALMAAPLIDWKDILLHIYNWYYHQENYSDIWKNKERKDKISKDENEAILEYHVYLDPNPVTR